MGAEYAFDSEDYFAVSEKRTHLNKYVIHCHAESKHKRTTGSSTYHSNVNALLKRIYRSREKVNNFCLKQINKKVRFKIN